VSSSLERLRAAIVFCSREIDADEHARNIESEVARARRAALNIYVAEHSALNRKKGKKR
jgi:hypothetical protein